MKRFLILLLALLMTGCVPSSPNTPESTTETEEPDAYQVLIYMGITLERESMGLHSLETTMQDDQRFATARKSYDWNIKCVKEDREKVAAMRVPEQYEEIHGKIIQCYDELAKEMENVSPTSDQKERKRQLEHVNDEYNVLMNLQLDLRDMLKEENRF